MADDREDYAHLLYYLRGLEIKRAKWNGDDRIDDHYELTTHQNDLVGKDILFITRTRPTPAMIIKSSTYMKVNSLKVTVNKKVRTFNIYLLKNWK